MKNRKWIAAAALAAGAVFVVMVLGERASSPPPETSSADAVLTAEGSADDGGQPARSSASDQAGVIDAVQQLIDELGIDPDDLQANDSRDDNSGANNESGRNASITIDNFAFGQPVTVAPGTAVTVNNLDSATHNVTATDGSFKTPNLSENESATFTAPDQPGRYEFSCTLHPEMTGTLIVEGDADDERGDSNRTQRSGSERGDDTSSSSRSAPSSSSKNGGDTSSGRGAAEAPDGSRGASSGY